MKFDIDFLGRGYVANLLRDRAAACRVKAEGSRVPRIKDEWTGEARYAETLAETLSAGEIEADMREVTKLRDLDTREAMAVGTETTSTGS